MQVSCQEFHEESMIWQRVGLNEYKFNEQCIFELLKAKLTQLRGKIAGGQKLREGHLNTGSAFTTARIRDLMSLVWKKTLVLKVENRMLFIR